MRKASFFIFLSLFCIGNYAFCQSKNKIIDSLEIVLKENQNLRAIAHKKDYFKIDTTRVNALCYLSSELLLKADYELAKPFLNEAIELSSKIDFKRGQVKANNSLGEIHRRQSEYPIAQQNFEKALKIAKEIGYQEGIAHSYASLGNLNNNISNYPEALKNHLAALKIREKLNDRKGIASTYNNLGINSIKTGNYNDALKYYSTALKIGRELNDKRAILSPCVNIGNLYDYTGDYKEALNSYFEAVKISQALGDKRILANTYYNIGGTYFSMEDVENALDYNIIALSLHKSMSNDFGIIRCCIKAATIHKSLKEFQTSRLYLDSAIRLSKEIGAKELIRDSYELLSDVDSLEFNWLNAYHNYKTYTKYKDSIFNIENTEKMKQSQIQYELEKKDLEYQKIIALKAIQFEYKQKQVAANTEKEKQRLKYEQKIKEQKLNFDYSKKITKVEVEQKHQLALNKTLAKENNLLNLNSKNEFIIRWLMILALISFVAFGIYYYKNYKSQKAANILIAKQREDLKELINELNHRVKNNFQTVGSMLKMQTRSLEDKTLKEVLLQTSNRFLAIAGVHEKLYQLEVFSDIPIKDYLYDIVGNISHQFGAAKDQFEYNIIDTAELKVNIQTVLPLVLIVNELVTNTFKHAYNASNKLAINISIAPFQDDKFQLIYSDNGPGLPPNFSETNRFGLKMLKLFAEQLHGNIKFHNDKGAVFILTFEYEN